MPNLWHQLGQPEPYRAAIERLIRDATRDDRGEVALLQREAAALAGRLAREIAARTWVQGPVERRLVTVDKPRELVALGLVDRVMHAAIATCLAARLEPALPASLYSYRPGRGARHATAALVASLRASRLAPVPLRERGLFVLRFDIASYGDSVPVGADSELWPALRVALPGEEPWLLALVQAMARCDRAGVAREVGLPNGSPIANPLLNLYLVDLDHELAATTRLALRFGDDCLVLCDDEASAVRARETIERVVARKRLAINPEKRLAVYWNAAGRPGPPGWRGTSHVAFVGAEVAYTGAPRLKAPRRRALLHAIYTRIANLARLVGPPAAGADPAELRRRAELLCRALRPMLDTRSPFALRELPAALAVASDRGQLAQLDRAIAIAVASVATGTRGAGALRTLSWRTLGELGLPSLVRLRNRGVP